MISELEAIQLEIIKLRLDIDSIKEQLKITSRPKKQKCRLFDPEGNYRGF